MLTNFNEDLCINAEIAKERLSELQMSILPKLGFFSLFKSCYKSEHYVSSLSNRKRRSLLAQLHLGILPLNIETGRYQYQ